MAKEEAIEVMAKVLETLLPNAMFRVELEESQHQVLAFQGRCESILSGFFLVIGCW